VKKLECGRVLWSGD